MKAETLNQYGLMPMVELMIAGAKGFYTLGVLKKVEAMIERPLSQKFNLVFGSSPGAIIESLVALRHSADFILHLYRKHIPTVERRFTSD